MDGTFDVYKQATFDVYKHNKRHSASIGYQQGFSDAMKESETFNLEIYLYMLFFIIIFVASHMIPIRRRIDDHFI